MSHPIRLLTKDLNEIPGNIHSIIHNSLALEKKEPTNLCENSTAWDLQHSTDWTTCSPSPSSLYIFFILQPSFSLLSHSRLFDLLPVFLMGGGLAMYLQSGCNRGFRSTPSFPCSFYFFSFSLTLSLIQVFSPQVSANVETELGTD